MLSLRDRHAVSRNHDHSTSVAQRHGRILGNDRFIAFDMMIDRRNPDATSSMGRKRGNRCAGRDVTRIVMIGATTGARLYHDLMSSLHQLRSAVGNQRHTTFTRRLFGDDADSHGVRVLRGMATAPSR